MQTKFFLLINYLLLFCAGCFAQSHTLKHIGIKDGLSNNYVVDIVQDGQGFIWVATESGLNRFDGKHFTVFKENNSGLVSNAINTLLYNVEENTLWVGTKNNGLAIFNCETQQFEDKISDARLTQENIVNFSLAGDSGIWITRHSGEIIFYNNKNKQFTSAAEMGLPTIRKNSWCSYDDGKGHLYVGHAQGGLSIINLKDKTVRSYQHESGNPRSLPGNSVYQVYVDYLENIWIGTNKGLALFRPETEEFIVFSHEPGNNSSLVADHIYGICEMNNGTLWIAADVGGISILNLKSLSFMDPREVKFTNITAEDNANSLSSANIRTLLQDSFGNIWIGNYSSGVDFISHTESAFRVLPYVTQRESMIKNKPVWSIHVDDEQQIWVGGKNEIAVFKNNRLKNVINFAPYLDRAYGQLLAIESFKQNTLFWGIYDDGLLKYNIPQKQIERIKLDMAGIDIITLFEDHDGKIWIGSEYGIYTYENNQLQIEDELNNQLKDRSVHAGILRDRQGKLWVGTYAGGIFVFDANKKLVIRLSEDNGLCSNFTCHLTMDSNGEIWVATRNGVMHVKDTNQPGNFEIYNDNHGLVDNYVRAIREDQSGNIWISTTDGISHWNKDKLTFDNYDYRDGLNVSNFTDRTTCLTSDGTIYFGSLNGVCYFNPEELTKRHRVAPVRIVESRILNDGHGKELPVFAVNGRINLTYHQNSFRVLFSVPDHSQNQLVEYAYCMEGLDNRWNSTQGESQITFRNISPGEYTFRVKARLKNHEYDEANEARLIINIAPPLWLTWYARLFYFIILCLVVYYFLRSYKNKLKLRASLELERKTNQNKQMLNDERLRFYTNITHELRTPLTLIIGPLEDLLNDTQLSTYYNKRIHIIYDSALRLLNLINQILEFRKTETQNRKLTVSRSDLGRLVAETGLRYKELNQNEAVAFYINIETKETLLYFDTDMVTTILNNLLSNAVKYTSKGEVRLCLRSLTEKGCMYTEIEVSDTGYGIDQQALPHIFDRYYQAKGKHQASGTGIGLALVKSLAELHEGTLHTESVVGKGTSFTFRLLTENSYPNALHTEEKEATAGTENVTENTDTADSHQTILIIEDNKDIREYIASSLVPEYQVITAKNGKEGLEKAQQDIPDIIVSDIMMPEMEGTELCRIIKGDIRTSHIPVVLLTAKDSIRDKEEGYKSGADAYITKPFSAKLLQGCIHNQLESRRKIAEQIKNHTKAMPLDANGQERMEVLTISPLDQEFLLKLTHIIEENLDLETLDINFCTEKMNMSRSTFYRKLKGLTGISANEFIRKIRLKNCLRLFIYDSYNISEAAYMTGFNDIGYFRQCFKEEYGMTPSEYLKEYNKKEK